MYENTRFCDLCIAGGFVINDFAQNPCSPIDKEPELLGLNWTELLLGRLMMGTKERALTISDTSVGHYHLGR